MKIEGYWLVIAQLCVSLQNSGSKTIAEARWSTGKMRQLQKIGLPAIAICMLWRARRPGLAGARALLLLELCIAMAWVDRERAIVDFASDLWVFGCLNLEVV